MCMKKILPKVLLHLTEIDVKMFFDVKTVSLKEKQTARVFCSEYERTTINYRNDTRKLDTDRFEMDAVT